LDVNSKEKGFEGGFGKKVLGETWVNHTASTARKGPAASSPRRGQAPILRGIKETTSSAPTDVYTVNLPLPAIANPWSWPGGREPQFDANRSRGRRTTP